MKILFEEHKYRTESVKNILGGFVLSGLDLTKEYQQLNYVGYFFNKDVDNLDGTKGDLVFILPKVLMNENEEVFGLTPEQLIDFNWKEWKEDSMVVDVGSLSKRQVYDFIYGFTTWIYRAIDIYRKNQKSKPQEEKDDTEAEVLSSITVGESGKKENVTFMDILLSLIDFQRHHKDFITFVIKTAHSGFNKISWPKTIARSKAIIQDGTPIYLDPINKKRVVNFDEELLVIYFSILNYLHEEYGFPITDQPGYKLITGTLFKSYLKSMGKTRLHKIRYKYFSDEAILLWNLCYAFFDKSDNIKGNTKRKDYLLINSFHCVFEAMIDELIGDKNLPAGLKVHGDDKRIDHLYTYKYLLENNDCKDSMSKDIYNIADSKYYKRNSGLKGHDVPKQFTYARNVIQWHMDLINNLLNADDEKYMDIQLFDKITEGFNIIPNFFISAIVDESLSYNNQDLDFTSLGQQSDNESYFFKDRLFDRSTLFTLHYDVNFLYILKMYAQNKSLSKYLWKMEVRNKFRDSFLKHLNNLYDFYQILIPSNQIETFVEANYRKLQGKVFSFEVESVGRVLLYAERKPEQGSVPSNNSGKDNGGKDVCVDKANKNLLIGKESYPLMPIDLGTSSYTFVTNFVLCHSVSSGSKPNVILNSNSGNLKQVVLHNQVNEKTQTNEADASKYRRESDVQNEELGLKVAEEGFEYKKPD